MQSLGADVTFAAGLTAGGLTAAAGAVTKWRKKSNNNADDATESSENEDTGNKEQEAETGMCADGKNSIGEDH